MGVASLQEGRELSFLTNTATGRTFRYLITPRTAERSAGALATPDHRRAARPPDQAGTTTYCRRQRSWKVTGPRGPGTRSTLIPVSGTPRSLNPSSSRVLTFQNAPVPR